MQIWALNVPESSGRSRMNNAAESRPFYTFKLRTETSQWGLSVPIGRESDRDEEYWPSPHV
jgi:hypothetical protein